MGFCSKCGRQRTGTGEFCTGCGAQFGDAPDSSTTNPTPADSSTAEPPPAPETFVEPAPASETTVEPVAPAQTPVAPVPSAGEPPDWAAPQAELPTIEPTRWDTHWYKPGPSPAPQPLAGPAETPPTPGGPSGPSYGPPSYGQGGYGPSGPSGPGGYGYGPASYTQGSPGQAPAGQGPYGQPPYQSPPHVPGTIGTPPLRRSQTAILTILLVVVLLAVGGGAYALVSHFTGHKTASPPSGNPTLSAPATQAAGTTTPASPRATATTSPTSSPTSSPKVSPSARVTVAAGATANPAEPRITAFLDRYFTAINSHNYTAYSSLLDAREQSVNTPSSFNTGYGSTTDSTETLTGITGTSAGGEAATVSFTSHQSPAESPTKTSCTSWTITLYLQPNAGSYLIGPAPAGYHASYQAC
jgi:hypothetical protein